MKWDTFKYYVLKFLLLRFFLDLEKYFFQTSESTLASILHTTQLFSFMFASCLSFTSVPVIKYSDIKQLRATLPGLFYDGSHHVHGQEWSEPGVGTPLCSCFLVCAWCPLLTSCRTPFLDNAAPSGFIFPNQSVLFILPQACTHRPVQSRQSFIEMLWACDYTLCQLKLIITPVIYITNVS